MVRTDVSRLAIAGIITALVMVTAMMTATAQAQGKNEHAIVLRIPAMVGLAVDNRCNLYTASRHTGYVFCIPPLSEPILLAKVPGTPTSIAVDRLCNVFIGTEEGSVFLISQDGTVAEAYRCGERPMGLEIDRDGGLFIATRDGKIIKVKRKDFLGAQ